MPDEGRAPDRATVEKAVSDFLDALGLDRERAELVDTPRRVADAWIGTLVDGYRSTPTEALGECEDPESGHERDRRFEICVQFEGHDPRAPAHLALRQLHMRV